MTRTTRSSSTSPVKVNAKASGSIKAKQEVNKNKKIKDENVQRNGDHVHKNGEKMTENGEDVKKVNTILTICIGNIWYIPYI